MSNSKSNLYSKSNSYSNSYTKISTKKKHKIYVRHCSSCGCRIINKWSVNSKLNPIIRKKNKKVIKK